VALIAKKGILTLKEKHQEYPESTLMNREEAISAVIEIYGSDAIYLATTGRATRELHEQLKLKGIAEGHEFLNVGSMGHVSSVGLGIALAKPEQKVIVFDGDAAAVMHMGNLATIGRYQPKNLIHIVLNNGVNESVGGQPSAGQVINLTSIAKACGYSTSIYVEKDKDLRSVINVLSEYGKPVFLDVHVRQGIRKDVPKLDIDHQGQKKQLMEELKK
jgi:phosphonopyruvate decarboxylase